MRTQASPPSGPRVELKVHIATSAHGRKQIRKGPVTEKVSPPREELPRITKLLALAHRWNWLIEESVAKDQAEIARLMGLSAARISQIMDLLNLAPDIQETIILGATIPHIACISERAMRPISGQPVWEQQRRLCSRIFSLDTNPRVIQRNHR